MKDVSEEKAVVEVQSAFKNGETLKKWLSLMNWTPHN